MKTRQPYVLFKRKLTTNGKEKSIWYFYFYDSSGKKITKSTGKTLKREAKEHVERFLGKNLLSDSENPLAFEYLVNFWKADSPYVKGKELRTGRKLSVKYIQDNRQMVERILKPFLENKKLLDLNPESLESMILELSKKYNNRRLNTIIQTLKVPYAHFCKMKRIPNNLEIVSKLHESPKERGILTIQEMNQLITLPWNDPRVKGAVLLAGLCGLRLGEIRGLQWQDIDFENGIILVKSNYIYKSEGLKSPKWNSSRSVPVPEPALKQLKTIKKFCPKGSSFVFYNIHRADSPINPATVSNGFKKMLQAIGISEKEKLDRNIVFHSLRHTFVSISRAGGIPDFVIMRLAGHKNTRMMENYTNSSVINFQEARKTLENQLKKASGEEKK